MDSMEMTLFSAVDEIARLRGVTLPRVTRELSLAGDLSFDSLDFAQLVAVLEQKLGYDPFASGAALSRVRTVGDLVDVYRSPRS